MYWRRSRRPWLTHMEHIVKHRCYDRTHQGKYGLSSRSLLRASQILIKVELLQYYSPILIFYRSFFSVFWIFSIPTFLHYLTLVNFSLTFSIFLLNQAYNPQVCLVKAHAICRDMSIQHATIQVQDAAAGNVQQCLSDMCVGDKTCVVATPSNYLTSGF